MYDSAEQLHATGNIGRALLATPMEPQQIKHERRVCPLKAREIMRDEIDLETSS